MFFNATTVRYLLTNYELVFLSLKCICSLQSKVSLTLQTGRSYRESRWIWRTNESKFKTLGKLRIGFEESIEYCNFVNEGKPGDINRYPIELENTWDLDRLCPKAPRTLTLME